MGLGKYGGVWAKKDGSPSLGKDRGGSGQRKRGMTRGSGESLKDG